MLAVTTEPGLFLRFTHIVRLSGMNTPSRKVTFLMKNMSMVEICFT